jgi:hypothetical protein
MALQSAIERAEALPDMKALAETAINAARPRLRKFLDILFSLYVAALHVAD